MYNFKETTAFNTIRAKYLKMHAVSFDLINILNLDIVQALT